jgi:hypothetical protein
MSKFLQFIQIVREYEKHHSNEYARRIAYGIVFRNLPF